MDVHVRVDLDDDVPVVVKSATGPAAERLRREHDRLHQAVHPGVVALAGAPAWSDGPDPTADGADEHELRTCYAGEPVARWTGSLRDVAGVGAAVASTLADLHDLGIVHGRLDATHVLIGEDGRPRLCGLAQPGDATPADDVAALGALLGELVGRAPAERRGVLRWPHRGSSARRALHQVIERAADPVPTRRPSARALADAILVAVPTADLPSGASGVAASQRRAGAAGSATGSGSAPGSGSGPRPAARPATTRPPAPAGDQRDPTRPDTLDRIWSFADERSDDERWAAAFGAGPPDLPARPDADGLSLPIARVDTPAWSTTAPDERVSPPVDDLSLPAPDDPFDRWSFDDGPAFRPDPAFAPGHDDLDDEARKRSHTTAEAAIDDHDLGLHHAHPRVDPAASGPPADDDLTRDHRVAGGRVAASARRPPAHDRPPPGPARGRLLALGAVALVIAAVGMAGAVIIGSGGGADTSRSEPEAAAPGRDCPPAAAPAADVDGDGCPEPLVVDGTTVDAGIARWSLGEPGDLVTVGDWDCDGGASAALLRPATGDVFVFTAWARTDEPVTISSNQRVDGGVAIRAEPGAAGCDRLLVDLAVGGTTTVEVPG